MTRTFAVLLSVACSVSQTCAYADGPLIVAHRGLLRHAPENTLANFRACLELRLGFEFDVERTKDGHLVCIHDGTVDRTTNGTGKVSELTLAQLRELDAGRWFDPKFVGEKVPTVDEVLKLIAEYRQHDVLIAVDLKAANVGQDVVRLAEQHKVLNRLLFIGRTISDSELRKKIKEASPKALSAAVANSVFEFSTALSARNADWVYVRYLPTREAVEAVHRTKKRVFIAGATVSGNVTVNWRQAVEAGIDGILTDYPLELRTTLRQSEADDGHWQSLFDGKSLEGWDAEDHDECFKVQDGAIVAGGGPLARLSYVGPINKHDFKNFELKIEVMAKHGSNGGVFFHTGPQSKFLKKGYEAQVCNSCGSKGQTGSLFVIKNLDTSPVKDDEWFEYHILVSGKRIVIKVNGKTTVDYTEPTNPKRLESWEQRVLSHGLIALQAHDPESTVLYRKIRLKVLPESARH
ncbi:MAG: glycerophosphoryl diester phosphodiesterase [Planctomycetaceae bacterium]|jgi:glycerophosphoryl diester phosphodiesterase